MENMVVLIATYDAEEALRVAETYQQRQAEVVVLCSGTTAEVNIEVIETTTVQANLSVYMLQEFTQESVDQVIQSIHSQMGRIDVLINNFDRYYSSAVVKERGEWQKAVEVNLAPVYMLIGAVSKLMVSQHFGRIINVTKTAWLGVANEAAYSMAKGALISLSRSLALEFAQDQITVNTVVQGILGKEKNSLKDSSKGGRELKTHDEETELVKVQPIPRAGSLEEYIHALFYFSEKENDYVTGQTLYVCGGLSLYSSLSL